jgi:hypothetical protein
VLAIKSGGPQGWEAAPEEVVVAAASASPQASVASSSLAQSKKKIETDSRISQHKKVGGGTEREALQAVPKEWLEAPSEALGGAAGNNNDTSSFDQFKVNAEKFGVKSTYKEEFYTTELNRNQVTAEQNARAERIAREIEGMSSTNTHLLEERGKKPLDDALGDDEEAKYGAVLGSGGYEKYKPPAKRGANGPGALRSPPPTAAAGPTTTAAVVSPTSSTASPSPSPPPPPPPALTVPPKPVTSYASMVKGQKSSPTSAGATSASTSTTASSPTNATVPSSSSLPTKKPAAPSATTPTSSTAATISGSGSLLSKKSSGSDTNPKSVVINATPDKEKEKKKREEEIREFKHFSKSYISPSSKPLKARTSPPSLNLEASPNRKPVEHVSHPTSSENDKKDDSGKVSVAPGTSPKGGSAAGTATDEATKKAAAAAAAAKKSLNPNAKNFNPSAPSFVPGGGAPAVAAGPAAYPVMQQPMQPTVVMAPQQQNARPRFVPMPPPPMMPYQGQQSFMFQGGPPMGGYVMPLQMPYNPQGGRPMVFYPPPPPQMFAPQMLIPVPYSNLPAPPPPIQQMLPLPPPASPQQQSRNPPPPT